MHDLLSIKPLPSTISIYILNTHNSLVNYCVSGKKSMLTWNEKNNNNNNIINVNIFYSVN
jgi:hypothetical protein